MEKGKSIDQRSRREFIKKTAYACSAFPFVTRGVSTFPYSGGSFIHGTNVRDGDAESIIGAYGKWAAGLLKEIPELSFRKEKWTSVASWKKVALEKTRELVASPEVNIDSEVTIHKKYNYDGLEIEELSWQLSNSNDRTEAILLKPEGAKDRLPAILGLHDHGGSKYFGKRKITKVGENMHPLIEEHQREYYEGFAWANEIAKRGYVVLVHDTFAFASRRVLLNEVKGITWGGAYLNGITDSSPEEAENIEAYNKWASNHEHVMSKSLFCAGTTWPGVVLAEDQVALDVLSNRKDVDAERIGCAGLSGGGLRTCYLAGLDHRIKCAFSVGFMSTWKDFLLNKAFTHTWMLYTPLLPQYLDFPEILGLRAPLPTLVLNNKQDQLFTLAEMEKANAILAEVYHRAGASEKYRANFYDGPHKFDAQMQKDAFNWFDKWLKI